MFYLYLLLLFGFIFSHGLLTLQSIIIFPLVILLFILFFQNKIRFSLYKISPYTVLCICILLSLTVQGGLYFHSDSILIGIISLLYGICLVFSVLLGTTQDKKKIFFFFLSLFILAVVLRIVTIFFAQNPPIDVYDILKNGALGFLKGMNPYTNRYTPLYKGVIPDYYSYPPGMLLVTLPFVALFKDPRYTFLAAEVCTAILVERLLKNRTDRYAFSLLCLFHPNALIMTELSFTDPLYVCLLLGMIICTRKQHFSLAGVLFGIALSGKQYIAFLLPVFLRLFTPVIRGLNIVFLSCIIAGLVILPFFLWNQHEFLREVIYFYVSFPARNTELTFFSFLSRFGIMYNPLLSSIIIGAGFLYVYVQKKITSSRFFYVSAFLYLIFFFFNKHAYINYYYLVSQLFLLGIVFDTLEAHTDVRFQKGTD